MTAQLARTIDLHCLCADDTALLPHFFRHYDRIVDKYHFWDVGARPETLELLRSHPKVTIHAADTPGDSLIDARRTLYDRIWQESRGHADWVILVDPEEHLYHPNVRAYLAHCAELGVTAVRGIGYEMVSATFPAGEEPLHAQIHLGCRSSGLDRLCAFSPNALSATHFSAGRHHAWPEGHVVWPDSSEILLLGFNLLGDAHFIARGRQRAAQLRPGDIEKGWAPQHDWTTEQWQEHAQGLRAWAKPVPGLGGLAHIAPEDYRGDERTVEVSGLLDADWYLEQYPDVKARDIAPLAHFCHYGWREGRRPNPYFETRWYANEQQAQLEADQNPLVHYITQGEASNARPSPHFDPAWYRAAHQLDAQESPLRHYLLRRNDGRLSPLPNFDLAGHLAAHPDLHGNGQDPYLHWLNLASADGGAPVSTALTYASILEQVGGNLDAGILPSQVPWNAFLAVLRRLVPLIPFDEAWYVEAYPDVAEAVQSGAMTSAHAHFIEHGFFEGRSPSPDTPAPSDPIIRETDS